ncbi:MAG: DUF2330 domain-containing protein [Polyangiales bacterium]
MKTHAHTLGLLFATVTALAPAAASACGGCFAPPEVQQVVTDHRMVMAIHADESILWDQIQYSGRPEDFSWVLPVRGMVDLQVASGRFFDLLDASTAVQVSPPAISCPQNSRGLFGGVAASANDAEGGGGVQVISTAVVGPYQTVTLRSSDGDALSNWLRANGYAIPQATEPVIRHYTDLGMDFVALRLRPGEGVQSMQPVRVRFTTPSPVLPLRMVAAGVADKVGISLFVFGEGRWEAMNFPNAAVDRSALTWDFNTNRSNYPQLFTAAVRNAEGRGWVTESAFITDRVAWQFRNDDEAYADWRVATNGLSRPWVTRLRTDLPLNAIDRDLQLASSSGGTLETFVIAARGLNAPPCPTDDGFYAGTTGSSASCSTRPGDASRGYGWLMAVGLAAIPLARRRRR